MFGKSDYKDLKEQYESTVKDLTAANITISALNEEVEDYKGTVEDLNESIKKLTMNHSVELENLKLKLKKTENSVNIKINAALASVGVTNFAVESISNPVSVTPEEAMNKFMALTGEHKTDYYNENKELITLALKSHKINKG